jgi:hypothetical protein
MEHSAYDIDVLDDTGKVIGHKPRREINKQTDIYHGVHIILITPEGQIVLSPILDREDLPNLYVGKYGVPAASIRRHGESSQQTAERAVQRELFIEDPEVHFVGEDFEDLEDGRKNFISFYYLVGDPPVTFSKTDISHMVTFTAQELTKQMKNNPEDFAPTLLLLWRKYHDRLPI